MQKYSQHKVINHHKHTFKEERFNRRVVTFDLCGDWIACQGAKVKITHQHKMEQDFKPPKENKRGFHTKKGFLPISEMSSRFSPNVKTSMISPIVHVNKTFQPHF